MRGPGKANTPIDDWPSFFPAFHQMWGRHQEQHYSPAEKRCWGQMLEFLESRARRDGYEPVEAVRAEQERQRRNDAATSPPDPKVRPRPRIIKSRPE